MQEDAPFLFEEIAHLTIFFQPLSFTTTWLILFALDDWLDSQLIIGAIWYK